MKHQASYENAAHDLAETKRLAKEYTSALQAAGYQTFDDPTEHSFGIALPHKNGKPKRLPAVYIIHS